MKISFITTVYNEEKTIHNFLDSLFAQTKLPDEIIIVDGKSTDHTVRNINNAILKNKAAKQSFKIKVVTKKGNRSIGRNEAVKKAKGDIIVCSDSGNILDKDWIKNIIRPFKDKSVDVVAGYYKGKTKNVFQKCLTSYVLVMPDKVDQNTFLPATRSMAFKKYIWQKVGGFDESLSHNEDYVFANKLKKAGAKIVLAKDALVYWIPRDTYREAFVMFFRFAFGDAEAGILRTNVLLLFARYLLGAYLLFLSILLKTYLFRNALFVLIIFYILWSIKKNFKYAEGEKSALLILPILQFTADAAVVAGTVLGLMKKVIYWNILHYIIQNKLIISIILIYVIAVSITLKTGTPNTAHPFPYHMDEWHQLAAVRAIIKQGTTTIPGVAQIPFLYPLLGGIYLIPFMLIHIINPFSLKSPVGQLTMQEHLFEILRSVNIWFGVGGVLLITKISKDYLKINYRIPAFFFAISPLLIMLSGYFKYDVGLVFFITLSLMLLFRYGNEPNLKNYFYAAIASALAMSVKFSAIPLLPLLIIAYFLFTQDKKKNYKTIVYALSIYLIVFLLVGVPNIITGKADYRDLIYTNIIAAPGASSNTVIPNPWWIFLPLKIYPYLFGHIAYWLGIAGCMYSFVLCFKTGIKTNFSKNIIFLLLAFILFTGSLAELKLEAIGNRVLVLLPFISLFIGILSTSIYRTHNRNLRWILVSLFTVGVIAQVLESSIWIYTKTHVDPQKESSIWIENNIKKGAQIGIENIPIYQLLPNIVVKEFYQKQYNLVHNTKYNYEVIDKDTKKLPSILVITNAYIPTMFYKKSDKKLLIHRIEKSNYKKTVVFTPDFTYFKMIGDQRDFYFTSLIAAPLTISIYRK